MMLLFILQHTEVIEEKIKNAPDSGYQIGVVIGSFIPFLVLIILAYWLYYRAKKREKES